MYLIIATARICATLSLLIWRAEMTLLLALFGMELVSEVTLCQNGMSLECQYSIEVD